MEPLATTHLNLPVPDVGRGLLEQGRSTSMMVPSGRAAIAG
ncbi:hypothetical protein BTZ20_0805 [Rhodococcus sp. MTM3W5.2]|nr:hypothetical protein BTZ20_0805 [Rhodococcus sp. MTM3W5.2]